MHMESSATPDHLRKRHPLNRPWGLQQDGDLREVVWAAINARGPSKTRVTKVLGHATDKDIEQGRSTPALRHGNHHADHAATLGTASHKARMVEIA